MKNKILEEVMKTEVMSSLLGELSEEERKDFENWANDILMPLNELSHIVRDMSTTTESAEALSEAIHRTLSPEGFEEVKKWLGKS